MATFQRPFANLSRYQQAAVQPQPNVMDQFVQALNQGISLAQLPQTLQAEAQQRQQQDVLNSLKVALAQEQLKRIQNPQQAFVEELTRDLQRKAVVDPLSGFRQTEIPEFPGVAVAAPGAVEGVAGDLTGITERPAAVPLGAPTTPVMVGGVDTGIAFDPTVPLRAKEAEATAKTKGQRDLLSMRLFGQTEKQRVDFDNKMLEIQKKHDLAVVQDDKKSVAKYKNDLALLREKNLSTLPGGKLPAIAKERLSSIRSQRNALSGTLTQSTLPKQEITIRDEMRRLDALENSILDSLEVSTQPSTIPSAQPEPPINIPDRSTEPTATPTKEKISQAQAKSIFNIMLQRGYSAQDALDRINDQYESE